MFYAFVENPQTNVESLHEIKIKKPKCSKCGSKNLEIDTRFGIGVCFDCKNAWCFDDLDF